ncbi:MAG: hypothetical protein HKN50_03400 [Gammaproteobacteria bacterium]|nr:hypothetical protein [Gammaproteobacteria bacterium]
MCTLTWFLNSDGYELFFNRDESIARARAQLPTVQATEQVQYIAPTDADAGGTWIAVNQHGIAVCLLNHYQYQQMASYKKWISRGEVVRQFAGLSTLAEARPRFRKLALQDYRAFRMLIIDAGGKNCLCVWDGHQARVEQQVTPLKSSSAADAHRVKRLRRDLFATSGLAQSQQRDAFLDYHASHVPNKSAHSVCMHRPEANTVSLSHLRVTADEVQFRYADGAPCAAPLGRALSLPRVSPTASPLALVSAE